MFSGGFKPPAFQGPGSRRVAWPFLLLFVVLGAPFAAGAATGRGGEAPTAPPRREVLDLALRAYDCARSRGEVSKSTLVVIDYALPSTERRLWVVEPGSGRVLQHELVAHGRGSGDVFAGRFSNEPQSYQSSLGLFVGRDAYHGEHGLSLRLDGLEPGINDQARHRAIVMHGAWYATQRHAARWGRLGRSLGCPALDPAAAPGVIEHLRDGAALFVYAEDPEWQRRSRYLRCSPGSPASHAAARP